MKIKDAIAYLQKFSPDDICAFDVWTEEDLDRLLADEFPNVELDNFAREKVFNEMEAREDISWNMVKSIIGDLLDGEI